MVLQISFVTFAVLNLFVTIQYSIGQYAILQKLLFFEGLNKSREESKRHYVDNKPSLIELCKQRLLLYQSLEVSSRNKNFQGRIRQRSFVFKHMYTNIKQKVTFEVLI